jgi:translation initiation factor IF-1
MDVRRIVVNKRHGDIQVESVRGDTRFRVRLSAGSSRLARS